MTGAANPMRLLGFNCYMNDSAACLVEDGLAVAAVEEERFVRRKHTGEFPLHAIGWCLEQRDLAPGDLDAVTFNMRPWQGLGRRLAIIARNLPGSLLVGGNQGAKWLDMMRARQTFASRAGLPDASRFHFVPHHLCHAASAFYPSGFEEAAILVWDGSGEIASTLLAHGTGTRITPLRWIDFPQSAGYLYSAVTQYLGFEVHEGEGKVMGLASYGDRSRFSEFDRLYRLTGDDGFELDLSYFAFQRGGELFYTQKLVDLFGPPRAPETEITPRHEAIAAGLQNALERIGIHLVKTVRRLTGCANIVIAGGVGLNGLFNGRLIERGLFDRQFVQPASHDAGGALGGPLYVYHHEWNRPRVSWTDHALLGPSATSAGISAALTSAGVPFRECADPAREAAGRLAAGQIIGWFQGRAEYGPRALGNRSILADPRRAEMKDIVNARVKHREGFRPFAPAILAEHQAEYFTSAQPAPHMLQIFPVREEKRSAIPAVTHVDGTGRLQSVDGRENPLFRRLIEHFHELTGVPVVLNTSFNVRGEPIVNTPGEALHCFRETDLDALFLGTALVEKVSGERGP